jgi:hypothetical protein
MSVLEVRNEVQSIDGSFYIEKWGKTPLK